MIQIDFKPPCRELMGEIGISEQEVATAIADPHISRMDDRKSRLLALRWFEDGRVILVDASVMLKQADAAKRQIDIQQVLALIVAEVGALARAGEITRDIDMESNLAVIAEKFGLPVRCDPSEPFLTVYNGRYQVRPDNTGSVDVVNIPRGRTPKAALLSSPLRVTALERTRKNTPLFP